MRVFYINCRLEVPVVLCDSDIKLYGGKNGINSKPIIEQSVRIFGLCFFSVTRMLFSKK